MQYVGITTRLRNPISVFGMVGGVSSREAAAGADRFLGISFGRNVCIGSGFLCTSDVFEPCRFFGIICNHLELSVSSSGCLGDEL